MVVGMVASQTIDISRKGAEPAPKEILSPTRHQLIDHAVIVGYIHIIIVLYTVRKIKERDRQKL